MLARTSHVRPTIHLLPSFCDSFNLSDGLAMSILWWIQLYDEWRSVGSSYIVQELIVEIAGGEIIAKDLLRECQILLDGL